MNKYNCFFHQSQLPSAPLLSLSFPPRPLLAPFLSVSSAYPWRIATILTSAFELQISQHCAFPCAFLLRHGAFLAMRYPGDVRVAAGMGVGVEVAHFVAEAVR